MFCFENGRWQSAISSPAQLLQQSQYNTTRLRRHKDLHISGQLEGSLADDWNTNMPALGRHGKQGILFPTRKY